MVRKQPTKNYSKQKRKNTSKVGRVDVAFLQSNLVNNDYQMDSRNSFPPINL